MVEQSQQIYFQLLKFVHKDIDEILKENTKLLFPIFKSWYLLLDFLTVDFFQASHKDLFPPVLTESTLYIPVYKSIHLLLHAFKLVYDIIHIVKIKGEQLKRNRRMIKP